MTTEKKGIVKDSGASRLPLRGWALELARRWNAGTYSMFIVHGNVFDLFPVEEGKELNYLPLKGFLSRRLFPNANSSCFTTLVTA